MEASGTSGMKAALNGVPHLSIMDGWWIVGLKVTIVGWYF
jgi:starch phosphorylase